MTSVILQSILVREVKSRNNKILTKTKKTKKGAGNAVPLKSMFWSEFGKFALVGLGALIQGTGQAMFLIPAKIAPGGLNGFGIILNSYTGFPVGVAYVLMNIPFFIWALRLLGVKYILRTGFAILISATTIDLLTRFVVMPKLFASIPHDDVFLMSFFGAVMLGIGIGIVLRYGASLGGTDIIAQLLHWSTGVEYGKAILIMDISIISIVALVFRDVRLALYSVFALLIFAQVVNIVQSGMTSTKMVMIITNQFEKVKEAILIRMKRGVTVLDAIGGYTMEHKKILLCAVPQTQVSLLKDIVRESDEKAFVMFTELGEVMGKGFETRLPK